MAPHNCKWESKTCHSSLSDCKQALCLKWLKVAITFSSTIGSLAVVEILPIISTSLLISDTEMNSEGQGKIKVRVWLEFSLNPEMVLMEPINTTVIIMKHVTIMETMSWHSLDLPCTYLPNNPKGKLCKPWFTKMWCQHIWYFSCVGNAKITV